MLVRPTVGVGAILALCLLAGCLKIQREYPEKNQFVLEVTRPPGERAAASNNILQVNEFQLAQPYQGKGFKYRKGDLNLESDFYNEFFAPPGQMIAEGVRKWLDGSGLFKLVVSRPGQILPTHFLEGTVESIYGDYRSNPTKAVLEIEFVLTREDKGTAQIVFKKRYSEAQPAGDQSAKDLVQAWNEGLQKIVQQFESDLKGKI